MSSYTVTHPGIRVYTMFNTWVSLSLLHTGYKDRHCPFPYSHNRLTLSHGEIQTAVRHRYARGASALLERRLHLLLAGYFCCQADPKRDNTWSGKQQRPLSELAYHLASANAYQHLASVLCSLPYIKAKCALGLGGQLLEDYQAVGAGSPAGVGRGSSAQRELEKFLAKPSIHVSALMWFSGGLEKKEFPWNVIQMLPWYFVPFFIHFYYKHQIVPQNQCCQQKFRQTAVHLPLKPRCQIKAHRDTCSWYFAKPRRTRFSWSKQGQK